MPNEINPNNYNIDFFSTNFIGTVNATSFRDYLFSKNLQDLPPELVNGAAGNFSSDYNDKGVEKQINYTSISNPGDIDQWLAEGNFPVTVHQVRDIGMLQGNTYGPPSIIAYNAPELLPEDTGFIQYKTESGGSDFRQILLTDQLGFGPGAAINFPSPLNDVAKERRKEEAVNRLKTYAEDNILGRINLDPFGLLAGQDLILKDYNITVFPSVVGKIVDFASDALNTQIPLSPIPKGAFGTWGSEDDSQSYKDLMDATGAGTKSLIYDAVSRNKYGPTLGDPVGQFANLFGGGQPPQAVTYLTNTNDTVQANIREQQEKPLVDKINQAVGKFVDNLASGFGVGVEDGDLSPYEFEKPSVTQDPVAYNSEIGFDSLFNQSNIDTWEIVGPKTKLEVPFLGINLSIPDQGPIGTKIPPAFQDFLTPAAAGGNKNTGESYDNGMYWGSQTVNPFRRGILKYTQDLVNNSKGSKQRDKSRYIGVANDVSNYDQATGRHNKYSMGNTVTDAKNEYYCRSWSVRNPYRKVSDLIRHGVNEGKDSLTRPDFNLSVLGDNGFVKITPYVSDISGGFDGTTLKLGNPSVQKYMLSIENLAWQNTEHALKLPACQVGPNGGRIMWFPPYDISFTDNSSVNWDSTTFIGRGEPIYTYNSTERSGTLAFKIIVDHSMAVTDIKKKGEEALFRYFAGCEDPIEAVRNIVAPATYQEIVTEEKITTKVEKEKEPEFVVKTPIEPPVTSVSFFFRNARDFELDSIGTNLATELAPNANEVPDNYLKQYERYWPNGYLRSALDLTPPTITLPGFVTGVPGVGEIPNPAYTATSQSQLDSLNELAITNIDKLVDFLITPDGKRYQINIVGKTSDAGPKKGKKSNERLGEKRANTTKDYILNLLRAVETATGPVKAENLGSTNTFPTETEWKDSDLRWKISSTGEDGANLSIRVNPQTGVRETVTDDNRTFGDSLATVPEALVNRTSVVTLVYNPEIDAQFVGPAKTTPDDEYTTTINYKTEKKYFTAEENKQNELLAQLTARASEYMAWECSYFEKMKQDDPFVYDTLTQKLKYFHPAFHSMTPEGFNARLTFLKQCTRQGPNIAKNEPSNMAFGKPPICVLRIGDFYHTKIVIDSVNFTFDPLQWDLNPEGIGVQPMLCNVDISFKFIGGSSLGGPISELQNAVGFNFFANTGLYNPRTIYKSVKKYKAQRPDPITGLLTEFDIETAQDTDTFAFGAYVYPGQQFEPTGDIQGSTSTPPNDASLTTSQDQQISAGIVATDAKPSQELINTISQATSLTSTTTTVITTSTSGITDTVTTTTQTYDTSNLVNYTTIRGLDSQAQTIRVELKDEYKDKWSIFLGEVKISNTCNKTTNLLPAFESYNLDGKYYVFDIAGLFEDYYSTVEACSEYIFEVYAYIKPINSDGSMDSSRKQEISVPYVVRYKYEE
jgi:hypothetical protein